jgi:hypothetical protein
MRLKFFAPLPIPLPGVLVFFDICDFEICDFEMCDLELFEICVLRCAILRFTILRFAILRFSILGICDSEICVFDHVNFSIFHVVLENYTLDMFLICCNVFVAFCVDPGRLRRVCRVGKSAFYIG